MFWETRYPRIARSSNAIAAAGRPASKPTFEIWGWEADCVVVALGVEVGDSGVGKVEFGDERGRGDETVLEEEVRLELVCKEVFTNFDRRLTSNFDRFDLYRCLASKTWFHGYGRDHWRGNPSLHHNRSVGRKNHRRCRLKSFRPRCSMCRYYPWSFKVV